MNIIADIIKPVTGIVEKFIPDADKKAEIAFEIATLTEKNAQAISKAQIDVNEQEARSRSIFVAGWRPAVGWICAVGMGTNFLLVPISNFILALIGHETIVPMVDLNTMMPVLLGMLGLGTLRTYEKTRS